MLNDKDRLLEFADSQGITVTKTGRLGKVITKLFDALVEPRLIQPTFITGYPVEVSPLSRRSETDPTLTDRFELFIAGKEIANGFSELNDPDDQRNRFASMQEAKEQGDDEAHPMDEDFLLALEHGIAFHLGGGFHHAFPDHGEGFCLINDVAVAARALQSDGRIDRGGVIDLDVHQGNGTAAIFCDLNELLPVEGRLALANGIKIDAAGRLVDWQPRQI